MEILAIILYTWYNLTMVYIPLRVEKHRMSKEESNFLLFAFAIFTIGILFGAALSGYGAFPSRVGTSNNSAAVALATPPLTTSPTEVAPTTAIDETMSTTDDELTLETTDEDIFSGDESTIDEFFSSELTQVRSEVEINTARTFTLGTEIERLKDESVSLVAAFEQNCGSWADTCAAPYKDALDKNNSSYNRLASELELLINELDLARESERIILASQ